MYLQKAADLFSELQKTVLALMKSSTDGHCQPLADAPAVTLIEEIGGRAALTLQLMKNRLSQQDRLTADTSICIKRERL